MTGEGPAERGRALTRTRVFPSPRTRAFKA